MVLNGFFNCLNCNKLFQNEVILFYLPLWQVNANWMEFPPAPQKASTIISHWHLWAMCSAIFSGVTENHDSAKKLVFSF